MSEIEAYWCVGTHIMACNGVQYYVVFVEKIEEQEKFSAWRVVESERAPVA